MRPLSGIAVGRTTSKALMRSDATSRSRPSSRRYRSRTLPERTNAPASSGRGSATDTGGHLQPIEPLDDGPCVAQQVSLVEAGRQRLAAEARGHLGVGRHDVPEGAPLLRRAPPRAPD